LKAVIFDLDGVLVDSEWASAKAWGTALARFGYQLNEETFLGFVGTTDRSLAQAFAVEVGRSPAEVLLAAEQEMRSIAGGGLTPFPDAVELLGALTVPVAVASNSDRWRLETVLTAAGIQDRFEVSVSADEVAHPKPAPDVYLRAAELLGVDPAGCVVIEDSPTGITAARAAGMRVVAVRRGHFTDDQLTGADLVLDHLSARGVAQLA
jgi:HAD superfamily hydrolase (TIGR01509 family)